MRLLLPYPLLSVGLFVVSVLISGALSPPSIGLALILAFAIPQSMRALGVAPVKVRAPLSILKLTGLVAVDVLRSNWAVAQILLGRRRGERVSGFIEIPLDLRDRYGLAVMAIILTSTPGTLWVEYQRVGGRLLLHVLDLVGEDEWIRLVKGRYEPLLKDIFE